MSRRSTLSFLVLLGLSAAHIQTAIAAPLCTREDVDFYLRKSFSQAQITAICSGAPSEPVQVPVPVYVQPQPAAALGAAAAPAGTVMVPASAVAISVAQQQEANDIAFLNNAIDAFDVELQDGTLAYTRKICVDYGDQDPGGYQNRACPLVRYTIPLKGLKVISSRRKFLVYGQNRLIVEGKIEREVVGNLEVFNDRAKELIMRVLEKGPQTNLPVRTGISLERLTTTLRKLSG